LIGEKILEKIPLFPHWNPKRECAGTAAIRHRAFGQTAIKGFLHVGRSTRSESKTKAWPLHGRPTRTIIGFDLQIGLVWPLAHFPRNSSIGTSGLGLSFKLVPNVTTQIFPIWEMGEQTSLIVTFFET